MNADKAYEDYLAGMKYQDIADKYGVTINTVKSWKKRYGWQRKKGAHKNEGVQRVHTNKTGAPVGNSNAAGHGAPPGNQNANGNPGGGAPANNHNAVTHCLYAKYLPEETLEIAAEIAYKSPLDLLWEAITLKYAAIIRAQRIMYVANTADDTERLKSASLSVDPATGIKKSESRTFEITLAADKQAAFLNAQSKAMTALNQMIKQYEDMKPEGEAAYRIAKLKAEIGPPENENTGGADSYLEALKGKVSEVWGDGAES